MNYTIYNDKDDLAKNFAEIFYNTVVKFSKQEKINILLSGGNTPKLFFHYLVKNFINKIFWSKIHLFWGDERCVPYNHRESNFNMTKKNLLDFINIPSNNIHRIIGENKPIFEAERYSNEIINNLLIKNEWPIFDITILGIGNDGHTASMFPNNIELLKSKNICKAVMHPQTGQKRITVSGQVINYSKNIFFLVSGKKKSMIIDEIFKNNQNRLKYPAAHIKPHYGQLEWLLDKEAANLL